MNFQVFFKKSAAAVIFGAGCVFASSVAAQQNASPTPGTIIGDTSRAMAIAGKNNLYCAGYVQSSPINTDYRLVGAVNEQERYLFTENDVVYINIGATKGARAGDLLSVVRPRGQVETRWSRKNDLGFYVEEVGTVEIIQVKADVSAVRVKTSCSGFLLGDLVLPFEQRTSPVFTQRPALNLYGEPSGKARGQLFMARDHHEMLGGEQIVYIDLGAEDNVRAGDYLTIYRPLGEGNLFQNDNAETANARERGFQSNEYRGGKFSNQTARKSGSTAKGKVVTSERAKDGRPEGLRKVVGEMVILNVKEKTATAVITRTAQEIHTGDWVEVQ